MILFIDTEFADTLASELVSLALVSDCGRFEFYAERDPLPSRPTDFVRSVVYPLLERGARAMPDPLFTEALHTFFAQARPAARHGKILVAYDHRADLDLLNYALDGFEAPETPQRLAFDAFDLGLLGIRYAHSVENLFEADPALRARRHNAFIDAWVNRDAYLDQRNGVALRLAELIRQDQDRLRGLLLAGASSPVGEERSAFMSRLRRNLKKKRK